MAVSKRLRYEVLRRDNFSCRYCGATAPDTILEVDHVVPTTLGGSDLPENLVASCRDCNSGKSATPAEAPLVEDVKQSHLRWRNQVQEAASQLVAEQNAYSEVLDEFLNQWEEWSYTGRSGEKETIPLPASWRSTIRGFLRDGLHPAYIEEYVGVSMDANHVPPATTFNYFCGCCRNKIVEIHERARINADRAGDHVEN